MRLFIIFVLWNISFFSYAEKYTGEVNPSRATAVEMKRLPELCQTRFKYGHGSKEFARWRSLLGSESLHVHHYCTALVEIMRAATAGKHKRSTLKSARSNIKYILARVQNPNFILLPDMYYRLAIISYQEGKYGDAIVMANKSIVAKKNYLNPHMLLAEIHLKSGNKVAAEEVLLQAQQYHPNSRKVKTLLKKVK